MAAWRIQPLTTIGVTLLFSLLGLWPALALYGLAMFVGALFPSINVIDYWVSFVSRTRHRTVLYPKRFAAGMGGAMLTLAGVLGASGLVSAAWVIALVTAGVASLMAAFNFCVGCWIYNAVVAPWAERKLRAAS